MRVRFANQATRLLRPLALLSLIIPAIGLPIAEWPEFLVLAAAVTIIVTGEIAPFDKRWFFAALVIVVAIFVRVLMPVHHIDEGHVVFSPSTADDNPLATGLPPAVFAAATSAYNDGYEYLQKVIEPPQHLWAFSADGLWSPSYLSRSRKSLDFENRWSLRLGTLNELRYSIRPKTGTLYSVYFPVLFRFDIPVAASGEILCWRGVVLWPNGGGIDALRHDEMECRNLPDPNEEGRVTIYALDMEGLPQLSMRLDTRGFADHGEAVTRIVGILAAVIVMLMLARVRVAAFAVTTLSIAMLLVLLEYKMRTHGMPSGLSSLVYMGRDNDGLTHFSYGRQILDLFSDGYIAQALRGEADVFYDMPGMRYINAVLMSAFGDSILGNVLAAIMLPFVIFKLLTKILSDKWSTILVWIFLCLPLFESFGFWQVYYMNLAANGLGGVFAWLSLFGSVALLIPGRGEDLRPSVGRWLGAGLLLAVAGACRPNLAPMLFVFSVGMSWLAFRSRVHGGVGPGVALLAGTGALLLVSLHNWVYGGVFVPLTSSSGIPANLKIPPSEWAGVIAASLESGGNVSVRWQAIGQHLSNWVEPYEVWLQVAVFALVSALVRRGPALHIKVLSAGVLSGHLVFLFYSGIPRYTYGLWVLSLLILVHEMMALPTPRFIINLGRSMSRVDVIGRRLALFSR